MAMNLTDSLLQQQQHSVYVKSYRSPEFCFVCKKILLGLVNQGLKCEVCKKSFHRECYTKSSCVPDTNSSNQSNNNNSKSRPCNNMAQMISGYNFIEKERNINKNLGLLKCSLCFQPIKGNRHYETTENTSIAIHITCLPEKSSSLAEETAAQLDSEELQKKRFEIMRKKSGKVFKTTIEKREKAGPRRFYEGRITYAVDDNDDVLSHFWWLDKNAITIYDSSKLEQMIDVIPLSVITKAIYNTSEQQQSDVVLRNIKKSKYSCKFHLVTQDRTFHVGVYDNNDRKKMSILETASQFYNIFKLVYLPFDKNIKKPMRITAPQFEEKPIFEEYDIDFGDEIGRGTFGTVFGGLSRATNERVAIKKLNADMLTGNREDVLFQSEIQIQTNLQHPGLVKIHALYFGQGDFIFIVMERLKIDLFTEIYRKTSLSENETKFIAYQILNALSYLHSRQIAHCDLKPENILLVEDRDYPQVRLCDFGQSRIIGKDSIRMTRVGTLNYSSPELNKNDPYNRSIDIWAFGTILYICLTGCQIDLDMVQRFDVNFVFASDIWTKFKTVKELIRNELLLNDASRRSKVAKIMKHNWFIEDCELCMNLIDLEKRVNKQWISKALCEYWPSLKSDNNNNNS